MPKLTCSGTVAVGSVELAEVLFVDVERVIIDRQLIGEMLRFGMTDHADVALAQRKRGRLVPNIEIVQGGLPGRPLEGVEMPEITDQLIFAMVLLLVG